MNVLALITAVGAFLLAVEAQGKKSEAFIKFFARGDFALSEHLKVLILIPDLNRQSEMLRERPAKGRRHRLPEFIRG